MSLHNFAGNIHFKIYKENNYENRLFTFIHSESMKYRFNFNMIVHFKLLELQNDAALSYICFIFRILCSPEFMALHPRQR